MMSEAPYLYLIDWIEHEEPNYPRGNLTLEDEREIVRWKLEVLHQSELQIREWLVPLWMSPRQYREWVGIFFVPAAI